MIFFTKLFLNAACSECRNAATCCHLPPTAANCHTCRQLPADCPRLQTTAGNWCHLLPPTAANCCQLLTHAGNCWNLLTTSDNFWQLLTLADTCWHLLLTTDIILYSWTNIILATELLIVCLFSVWSYLNKVCRDKLPSSKTWWGYLVDSSYGIELLIHKVQVCLTIRFSQFL